MKPLHAISTALLLAMAATAAADLTPGLISDFEDGSTQGWDGGASPTNIASGGPAGVGDNYLQIGNDSSAVRLATFNSSVAGIIDPTVESIQVDLLGALGQSNLDMRLVLFGPGTSNRWTSAASQVVPSNGLWDTYTFSLAESDLTQVLGVSSYSDLLSNLNRIMLRYDPAPASAGGQSVQGTLGIDNVIALSAPTIGDYDGDGVVDADDYQLWDSTFGQVGADLSADGNGNGAVDAADYTVWRDAFDAVPIAIPEPCSLVLLGLGLLAVRRREAAHSLRRNF